MRPGLPPEPELQVRVATVGHVVAAGPLLVPPVLGGGDTLDDAPVSFLLAQSLLERQERREEKRLRRQAVEEAEGTAGVACADGAQDGEGRPPCCCGESGVCR